jgi:hypothetical protein
MSHLSMWTMMTMASVCRNKASLISWAVNVMGIWDYFGLGDRTFDDNVIDLSVIVSLLSIVVEVGV